MVGGTRWGVRDCLILCINPHTVADLVVNYTSMLDRDEEFARLTAQVKVDDIARQQHIAEHRAHHQASDDDDAEWDEDAC